MPVSKGKDFKLGHHLDLRFSGLIWRGFLPESSGVQDLSNRIFGGKTWFFCGGIGGKIVVISEQTYGSEGSERKRWPRLRAIRR
jgi:hypothetical protein